MSEQKEKKQPDKFLGYALIALGILGAIGKITTHQNGWNVGSIIKLGLIIGALVYGIWTVLKKKNPL